MLLAVVPANAVDDSSYLNLPALTPQDPLDTFSEMWYQILFWVFISSVLVHGIAAAVAFCVLRKHPVMRWYALALLIMGILGPLTWGNITSAMVAWIGLNSISVMPPLYAFIAGVVQTVLCTVVSFCRIFPSL